MGAWRSFMRKSPLVGNSCYPGDYLNKKDIKKRIMCAYAGTELGIRKWSNEI